MNDAELRDFATRYTAAWCSQDASSVAAFFSVNGSLTINGGSPAVGREAITAAAQSFMTSFPDMVVTMDGIELDGDRVVYHWTLTGTNTGPGGTGRRVRISGQEDWTFGAHGLVKESQGRFDEADYRHQIEGGPDAGTIRPSYLIPMAQVQSVVRSIAFYEKLGFEKRNTHTPEGEAEPVWAWLRSGGASLMLAKAEHPIERDKQAVLFYVYCADVSRFRATLLEAGVEAGPICHPFYAPRGEFEVIDPDGHVLMISHT